MSSFVSEIDVREALADSPAALKQRACDSGVLVIRQERFDLNLYSDLMQSLGRPIPHVLSNFSLLNHRDIIRISNLYRGEKPVGVHDGGTYWHTDMAYFQENTVFTSLLARRVPRSSHSGGTEFIDCAAGYRFLARALRSGRFALSRELDIETARVRHCFGNRDTRSARAPEQKLSAEQKRQVERDADHGLVSLHPLTGRKSIYGLAGTSVQINDLSDSDSIILLDCMLRFLLEHAPRYTHYYCTGDIVIWDNLSTLHRGQFIPGSTDSHDCRMLLRMNVDFMN